MRVTSINRQARNRTQCTTILFMRTPRQDPSNLWKLPNPANMYHCHLPGPSKYPTSCPHAQHQGPYTLMLGSRALLFGAFAWRNPHIGVSKNQGHLIWTRYDGTPIQGPQKRASNCWKLPSAQHGKALTIRTPTNETPQFIETVISDHSIENY